MSAGGQTTPDYCVCGWPERAHGSRHTECSAFVPEYSSAGTAYFRERIRALEAENAQLRSDTEGLRRAFDGYDPEAVSIIRANVLRNFSEERLENLARAVSGRYCRLEEFARIVKGPYSFKSNGATLWTCQACRCPLNTEIDSGHSITCLYIAARTALGREVPNYDAG